MYDDLGSCSCNDSPLQLAFLFAFTATFWSFFAITHSLNTTVPHYKCDFEKYN